MSNDRFPRVSERLLADRKAIATGAISTATTHLDRIVGASLLNPARAFGYRLRNGIPREANIPHGSRVVQVGMWRVANAVRLALAIGPSGRGLVVEASEEHAVQISEEFDRQGFEHMTVVHAAGWHENVDITIRESDEPSGNQVANVDLQIPKEFTGREFIVPGRRIDDLASEHGLLNPDYVELTVNGAEMDVLRGMPKLLSGTNRILVAGMMRDSTGAPAHLLVDPYLQEAGFQTQVSRSGRAVNQEWGKVDGHVFGYRT